MRLPFTYEAIRSEVSYGTLAQSAGPAEGFRRRGWGARHGEAIATEEERAWEARRGRRARAEFFKAHGLGNDYLVFEEGGDWTLTPEAIRRVCDRWRGPGSDGIVLLLADRGEGLFRLRMFNPDGSEFERSGNGLRVLAAFLSHHGRVELGEPFRVEVGGDEVGMTVHGRDGAVFDVSADMGRARVGPEAVGLDPAALDARGRIPGPEGETLDVVPVRVGNPHMVVLAEALTDAALLSVGPFLAGHPALIRGANVQLALREGRNACRILIWERGVGRTSASGTSSCAVAVALVERGLLSPGEVTVLQEGGALSVTVTPEKDVVLRGPVEAVQEGRLLASPGHSE